MLVHGILSKHSLKEVMGEQSCSGVFPEGQKHGICL